MERIIPAGLTEGLLAKIPPDLAKAILPNYLPESVSHKSKDGISL